MSFANSSVLVLTDAGVTHSYQTGQSSPLSVAIPAGSTGTWTWVVSREGYACQAGTFDTAGGGLTSVAPISTQRLQANGSVMYTANLTADVSIAFDLTLGAERCFIDVGDASVSAQSILDEVELALISEDGCKFLAATSCSEVTLAELPAGNFLLMGTGYRIRRRNASDVNATVEAFSISADGTPVDGANGSVTFLSASLTADQLSAAVWDKLLTDISAVGSIGELLKTNIDGQISLTSDHARAANSQTQQA